MPFFENIQILCRDPYVLVNYSTMKIEIAFMLNLDLFSIILEAQKIFWICSKSHIILHLSDQEQILRRNTNDHCDINALPPVNSNGKEGVAIKQSR